MKITFKLWNVWTGKWEVVELKDGRNNLLLKIHKIISA
jgi:hypothetical protein